LNTNAYDENNDKLKKLLSLKNESDIYHFIKHNNVDININLGNLIIFFMKRKNIEAIKFILSNPNFDITIDDFSIIVDAVLTENKEALNLLKEHKGYRIDFKNFILLKHVIVTYSANYFKFIISTQKNIDLSGNNNILLLKAIEKSKTEHIGILLKDNNVNRVLINQTLDTSKYSSCVIKLFNLIKNTRQLLPPNQTSLIMEGA